MAISILRGALVMCFFVLVLPPFSFVRSVLFIVFCSSSFFLMAESTIPHSISSAPQNAPPAQKQERATVPRFYILDLVRLVAMLFMMQGHTLDALADPAILNIENFPWNIWHFIRGLTAPIFLMISGAVAVFANKRDERGMVSADTLMKRIRWGLWLVVIGYFLVFPANRIFDLPFVSPQGWAKFFQVNILQLSGTTLIFLMLVLGNTRSNLRFAVASGITGVVIMLATPYLHSAQWIKFLPLYIRNYVVPSGGSLFPMFPFSAYMFFGVVVGYALSQMPHNERPKLFARFTLMYGAMFLAFGIISYIWTMYSPYRLLPKHNFFASSPGFILLRVGCALLVMHLLTHLYALTQTIGNHFGKNFVQWYAILGGKSLHIYVGHLVILFGTPWFSGIATLPALGWGASLDIGASVALALGVIIVCLIGVVITERITDERVLRYARYGAVAWAVYVLLV